MATAFASNIDFTSTTSNTGTLVGAATVHAAMSDSSDSSYVQVSSGQAFTVAGAVWTIPANSLVLTATLYMRAATVSGGSASFALKADTTTLNTGTPSVTAGGGYAQYTATTVADTTIDITYGGGGTVDFSAVVTNVSGDLYVSAMWIQIGWITYAAPYNLQPSTGTVPNNPVQLNGIGGSPGGQNVPIKREWQIASNTGFTTNLTTHADSAFAVEQWGPVTGPTLAKGTWYMRARIYDQYGGNHSSAWTSTQTLTVGTFPSSPTSGQEYAFNGSAWKYNGTYWEANTYNDISMISDEITVSLTPNANLDVEFTSSKDGHRFLSEGDIVFPYAGIYVVTVRAYRSSGTGTAWVYASISPGDYYSSWWYRQMPNVVVTSSTVKTSSLIVHSGPSYPPLKIAVGEQTGTDSADIKVTLTVKRLPGSGIRYARDF
jgi:hypothetical protein